ncbi:hypothetical protein FB451DRAFT_1523067 [Mycena latifolia]|nr:hypothetical protein FB451DRAFT_1523067 [Mycena latifolia]
MGGNKKKSKKARDRGTNTAGAELPTFPELLAAARSSMGPGALATKISRLLCLPDYNTSRGLKECHEAFDIISSKLDKAFALSREYQADIVAADMLAATIIVIYGRMGFDTILRERIFGETDFLQKAISLLRSDIARSIVMHILSNVTHVGNTAILKDLSRFTSSILDCVEGRLVDLPCVEKAVCVLSHSTVVVLNHPEPDPELVALISPRRVIHFFLSVIRLPNATSLSFGHFCVFCSKTTTYHPAVFQAIPDSIDFLVACTRAQDLCIRSAALRSLTGLHYLESILDSPPQKIVGQPARVRQTLDKDGPDRSHEFEMRNRKERSTLTALIKAFAENPSRSLSGFGLALVEVILRSEFLVRTRFKDSREEYRHLAIDLGGAQFVDVLRLCEDAVRSSGTGSQSAVMADILHLEFLLASEKDEACTVALSCIEQHPSVAFFYYVLATCRVTKDANLTSAVLFAEKEELLYFAAWSSDVIIADMLSGRPSEIRFQEVVALIKKASSRAISFVNDAPPDHPRMPLMIALGIHLAILVGGGTISDDFRELQTAQGKLFLAYDIARSQIGGFYPARQCLALDTIFSRMSIAWRVWKPIISRQLSQNYSSAGIDPNVDLAAWLEKLDTGDPFRVTLLFIMQCAECRAQAMFSLPKD